MMLPFFLALLPSRIHVWIRRRLGHQVHKSARLGFGAVITAKQVTIGANARIGPFTLIRATRLSLGERAAIAPLALCSAHTFALGDDSRIAPTAVVWGTPDQPRCHFRAGAHTRVFPLSWIEPGHGVTLGDHVGIGGHGLIFTHGSWANFFRGAPVTRGPVVIEDRVWLPWRVFIMPNVVVGENAIVAAGSVVTRDIPRHALAAGAPARVVKAEAYSTVDATEFERRCQTVVDAFAADYPELSDHAFDCVPDASSLIPRDATTHLVMNIDAQRAEALQHQGLTVIDLPEERAWIAPGDNVSPVFVRWLSTFGVRFKEA